MQIAKQQIIDELAKITKDLTGLEIVPQIEHPTDEKHGDYSSNIALTLFTNQESRVRNQQWKSPFELAQKIADKLMIHNSLFMILVRTEAVKPGFINFWLSKDYLSDKLKEIREQKEKYGRGESLKNQKIMVEFTDPNPFKEFHIGHLYSNTVGESVCRLLEANGGIVKRANYQGDVGMHVAKALWGFRIQNSIPDSIGDKIQNLEKKGLEERIKFLGKAYALGARAYEENEKGKKEIEELNKRIYDKDPAIMTLYEKGRQWSLEYFETIYKRLGTKFDFYYFESEVGKEGLDLVKEYFKKGVFEESQGAVIFPGEKYGLHNRVFINSLGLPTYEAKELGLAPRKYRDFNYDESIIITGNEIIGYFKVLLAALGKINHDLAAKTKHLSHGMVKLPSGKMSSRTGNILTGEWLLDEAKKLLKSKYSEMTEDTLERVAVGSVKYALLKSSIGHDMKFDFEESINIQGNSGPYLQYTFARVQSVLAKVKSQKSKVKITRVQLPSQSDGGQATQDSKLENEEISLLRSLNRFPEVVEDAGEKFSPNLLCNYLFDLAQKFNLFYQKHKILESEQREFRIDLTTAVGQIIKNGLYLLGIGAPEHM